jgi:hypothetical protein
VIDVPAAPRNSLTASPAGRVPLAWRAASWLATLAAGVALAAVLAHWGWRAFGPASVPLPPSVTPERWTPSIVATPLFGRAVAVAPAGVAGKSTATTTLQGETRLLGVFAERDGGGYALFRLPDRGPLLVRAGQEIANDVKLEAVHPDGVRIRDRGEVRDLMLRRPPATVGSATGANRSGQAAPSAACAAPAGYQGPVYRLNAELLTGIASQPESWKALLVPAGGGLAVTDESGFAAMLGMKAGDRMAQANGIALTGVDDVLVAMVKPLLASQPVRVSGTRNGKAAEWLFLNAGACPG